MRTGFTYLHLFSSMVAAGTISDGGPLHGAPLTAMIGDQQSAMVGQRCFQVGQAKITYGTGAFMLVNSGTKPTPSKHGLLSTALYQFGANAPPMYALEGAVASCAVGINWVGSDCVACSLSPLWAALHLGAAC